MDIESEPPNQSSMLRQ